MTEIDDDGGAKLKLGWMEEAGSAAKYQVEGWGLRIRTVDCGEDGASVVSFPASAFGTTKDQFKTSRLFASYIPVSSILGSATSITPLLTH